MLHDADPDGPSAAEILADIKDHPEIYYSDHVGACVVAGELPLSEVLWRRTCLSA